MSTRKLIVMLTLLCLVAGSSGIAMAAPRADEKSESASQAFPITEKWSVEKLLALTRDEVIALWKTLDPPEFTELDGHYMGIIPNAGDLSTQKMTR